MINVEELGWKKQLRCLLNTPDDELFDIMERDNSTICGFCEETYFQSIGQGVDHTATFVSFRNRYKKVRKSLIGSHIDKITITLQDLQRVCYYFYFVIKLLFNYRIIGNGYESNFNIFFWIKCI